MKFTLLLCLLPAVLAGFHAPTPRVAIIGAGAGGSSAAFWISKAKERFGLDVAVDVYESSDYVGGREFSFTSHCWESTDSFAQAAQ